MRVLTRVDDVLVAQRLHLFPWSPVFLAIGIGIWFMLRAEPGALLYGSVGAVGGICAAVALRWSGGPGGSGALWAVALVALGFGVAGVRAHAVKEPVLGYRYYGPVEGRIVGLERTASDALRITLDAVRLERVPPRKTPGRVRLTLHSDQVSELRSGQRVMTTAHLSPPNGPAEPGGVDFQRHAWFQRLGAVGYTRNPVLLIDPPQISGPGVMILRVRMAASERVREALPGDTGGFAAAVTTGDRSGMSQDAVQALRDSNLAHLLAISGLHMGLLAGFVFAAMRIGIAAVPRLALRVPGHRISALVALLAAAVYLALSGRSIATERAFIMIAVALLAVMTDRRALSIRSVALAALIVLLLRPEALLSPGFQMSFAATTALVAVFGWMRDFHLHKAPSVVRSLVSLLVSSFVAGAATAPVAAAHFNVVSYFGLVANLGSVPVMGLFVIPGAVAALMLAPLGLEGLGFFVMGLALDWVLRVAHFVAALPNAVGRVVQPEPFVLPVLSLGSLWLILWQGRGRYLAIPVVICALWVWTQTKRPEVLVSHTGGLVGVMTPDGRALSRERGQGFVARVWLENDGDAAEQWQAAGRWPPDAMGSKVFATEHWEILHLHGKRAVARVSACREGQIVVASVPLSLVGDCLQFGPEVLRTKGSLAIAGDRVTSARDVSGTRLWH